MFRNKDIKSGFSIDKIMRCSEDECRQNRYGEKPTTIAIIDTPYECTYTDENEGPISLPVFGTVTNTPIGLQCVGDISVWTGDVNNHKSIHELKKNLVFHDIRNPNGKKTNPKRISKAIVRYAKAIQDELLANMSKIQVY